MKYRVLNDDYPFERSETLSRTRLLSPNLRLLFNILISEPELRPAQRPVAPEIFRVLGFRKFLPSFKKGTEVARSSTSPVRSMVHIIGMRVTIQESTVSPGR